MVRTTFRWLDLGAVIAVGLAVALLVSHNAAGKASLRLLNASYDPTRELYAALNPRFIAHYREKTGRTLVIEQSHGGSSRQARRVVQDELQADVVTLGLPSDVEALQKKGLIAEGWSARLPNGSRPYASTIVFVVRRGNPRGIRDWPDLIRPGTEVIVPDPKSSGNGKLAALAAWGSIVTRGGTDAQARDFLKTLYAHAPFLVPAARESATVFAVERIGDVHLAWENEALREVGEARGELQVVYPPVSILAEPSVAWVDAHLKDPERVAAARAYLDYLYSDEAQETIAQFGYRPSNPDVLARHASTLPPAHLFAITAIARDWDDAQARFFADNGVIDEVYTPKPR